MINFKIEDIIDLLKENAEINILPHFQSLTDNDIQTKTHPGDLVTVADLASEDYLTPRLQKIIDGSLVVGEEAVAADKTVLNTLKSDKPIWIIDPIDGTYNFAHGRSKWGVFVGLGYKGEVVFGIMFDVLSNEFIFTFKGEGTHHILADQSQHQIKLSKPAYTDDKYIGHVGGAQTWHFKPLNDKCGEIRNVRCSLHDAWALLTGDIDFILQKASTPWDHSAPSLAITEAGGFYRVGVDKKVFTPDMYGEGYILATYNETDWDSLSSRFFPALKVEGLKTA